MNNEQAVIHTIFAAAMLTPMAVCAIIDAGPWVTLAAGVISLVIIAAITTAVVMWITRKGR
jgi:hypothetical protein